jgi:hypothetical protein
MPPVYHYNNRPWIDKGGKLEEFQGSWDDARAQFGTEQVGLSNEEFAAWDKPTPQAAPSPAPQTTQAPAPQTGPAGFRQGRGFQSNVPPPPPPPPPPDFAALARMAPATMGSGWQAPNSQLPSLLETFAAQGLQNPSRWDAPLVKESLGLIDQGIAQNRTNATRGITETLASRGVLGGSPEEIDLSDLERDLALTEAQRKNELAQRVAGDYAADRSAAGSMGLATAGFGDARSQYSHLTDRQAARDFEDDARARTGFGIQGGSLTDDALMARAILGVQTQGQLFGQGLAGAQFGEGQRQFDAGYGLQAELGRGNLDLANRSLAQQGSQFQQDFGLRDYLGREGIGLDREQMMEQARQFEKMSNQQKDQYAAQNGMTRAQLDEQVRHGKQLEDLAILDYLDRLATSMDMTPEELRARFQTATA